MFNHENDYRPIGRHEFGLSVDHKNNNICDKRRLGGSQVTQNLRINRLAQFILFPTPLAFCVVFGLKNGPYASENKEKNERFTMSTKKSASLFR